MRVSHDLTSLVVPAAAAVLLAAAAMPAGAAVLYDTTGMTDNQTYDSTNDTFIGGRFSNPGPLDGQLADDFSIASPYDITSVSADFVVSSLNQSPANGFLVEFFSDVGGAPSDTPAAAVLSSDFTASSFTTNVFNPVVWNGRRFTIDLSSDGVSLGAGTWWLSVTPVDETDDGGRFGILRTGGVNTGSFVHVRDGGIAHANGYTGIYGVTDWTPLFDSGFGTGIQSFLAGDAALRVEGNLVPSPGAVAMVGVSALAWRRRRN